MMTRDEKSKVIKTVCMFRDVHCKYFKNIRWLRKRLQSIVPYGMVDDIIARYRL